MKNKIAFEILPREKNIGIPVRRILPWAKKKMVGPFIFLDHMGPVRLMPPSDEVEVRPHPHIGLSTLTYLYEGSLLHRDSLGVVQEIVPGEVNWMTAGRGISHSERETSVKKSEPRTLHGLQFWVALPKEQEDCEPSFFHYEKEEIPVVENSSSVVVVVAGEYEGKRSPLKSFSEMIFLDAKTRTDGIFTFPSGELEVGLYLTAGKIKVGDQEYSKPTLLVFETGSSLEVHYSAETRFAFLGGRPLKEPRFIWWNFVSSSQEKIEAAKKAWESGTFPSVPGETGRIPLPLDS